MRIVMIGNALSLVSGHSRLAWEIAAGLDAAGHQVQVIASQTSSTTQQRNLALLAQTRAEAVWRRQIAFDLGTLTPGNVELTQRIGPIVREADVVHVFDLRALRAVRLMFPDLKAPVLMHLSSLPNQRAKYLLQAGGMGWLRTLTMPSERIAAVTPRWFVMRLLSLADVTVCTSAFLADVMQRDYRVPADRLRVVHTGVSAPDQAPPVAAAADQPAERTDFVYFGWPGACRGTLDAARAMARFKASHPDARCLVSSYSTPTRWGEHTLIVRALAGMSGQGVTYADFLPDIRRRIVGARAAVLPFRCPFGYAQVPLVVLEALAAGVPVISTDVGGVSEAVGEGQNGFLVRPGDLDACVERMSRLWDDPQLWARMSAQARRTYEQNFTIDLMVRRMLDVYERLGR